MKNQRWPGDYQTTGQEFASSKREEQMGMNDANASHRNDYMAYDDPRKLDSYQVSELDPSFCSQLDVVGMQPHSREYLEHCQNNIRSFRKFEMFNGQTVDHTPGIQFSGTP
jgi:hypothetical protein